MDEQSLYCDSGSGCESFLFDTDDTFTIIDCNGQWYTIWKLGGEIAKPPMEWEKALPADYMGTFRWNNDEGKYNFISDDTISIRRVYRYKDF